jgi:two-component system nitrogen regulation sensor histidine kinase NtrY
MNKAFFKQRKHFQFLVFSLIILCIWVLFVQFEKYTLGIENVRKKIESKLHQREQYLEKNLLFFSDSIKTMSFDKIVQLKKNEKKCSNYGFEFYYYDQNYLKHWSTNLIPVPDLIDDKMLQNKLWELKNGFYYQKSILTDSNTRVLALFPVQYKYPYENLYLSNSFHSSFKIPSNFKIAITPTEHVVNDANKEYLFSIFKETIPRSDNAVLLDIFMFFTILFFLLMSLDKYLTFKRIPRLSKYYIYALIFVGIIVFRLLMFYFQFPYKLYSSKLFSPEYYASSQYLPSLGDLLVNIMTLFLGVLIFFYRVKIKALKLQSTKFSKIFNTISGIVFIIPIYFLFVILVEIYQGVVFNSNIQLATENIFKFQLLSYLVFFVFALVIGIVFYLSLKCLIISKKFLKDILNYRYLYLFYAVVSSYFLFKKYPYFDFILLYIIFLSIMFYVAHHYNQKSRMVIMLLFILYASIFTSQILNRFNAYKEEDHRLLIAMKIANEHDPIVEYRLSEINDEIPKDTVLKSLFKNLENNEKGIIDYILKEYLSTFVYRYKTLITICSENQNLIIQPDNYEINCGHFFRKKINTFGSFRSSENIWFMNYEPGTVSYLSIVKMPITLENGVRKMFTIYIELDSKSYIGDVGYPELLIDKKRSNINPDITNYSYARYIYDDLVSQYGKFFYSSNLSNYNVEKKEPNFFENSGYKHLIFRATDKETIIIGKRIPSFYEQMVPISFFILLFGFFVLLFYLVMQSQPIFLRFSSLNFQGKLQFTMILIILSSFLAICIMTVVYFVNLNISKNIEIVTEKSHAILVQLEQQFNQLSDINQTNVDLLNDQIQRLSGQFFTDINFYDRHGYLIASSRPQMFQQGLVSYRINADAYRELRNNRKTNFLHNEHIGKQKYLSSYMPFRNNKGLTLAYINLPYFAKQEDLNKEISSFLIAFLSVYVLLTLVAIAITIFFAQYITRPLSLMRNKIRNIKLRGRNEKIIWKSKDEIGSLIEEYNRMVEELDKSAELLASSERDYAWREMAQQVAHEIKNPLTPMKLSIQYLQRAWDNKEPDWDDRLKRFSQTLVEQIDALSNIATAFSDFAKMPKGQFGIENLDVTIQSVISLFEEKNIQISFDFDSSIDYQIEADKTQLIRVLNNLIKNATQAVREVENGEILLRLTARDEHFLLEVTDNGIGISDALKHKIFSPNFTTKTGGMGLGLAMVKNIVDSMNGKIWFESTEAKGTSFYVQFRKLSKENNLDLSLNFQ